MPKAKPETGVRTFNEVRFLLNLLRYEILHLGRVLVEKITYPGLESASVSGAGVARGESGAMSGEAIDLRRQSSGDGLTSVMEETVAGVLGTGMGNRGRIDSVEGTVAVGLPTEKSKCQRATARCPGDGLSCFQLTFF